MEYQVLSPVNYHFEYPDGGHYKEYCNEETCGSASSSPYGSSYYGSGYYSSYSVSLLV